MNKYIFLLISLIVCSTNSITYATTNIITNHSQLESDPIRYDLIKIKSDFININQYEYNYILLYSNGEFKNYTKSKPNGIETSFVGYYTINIVTNEINIFTEEYVPYYFLTSDEHAYVNDKSIVIIGTLYGKFVKFEYKQLFE